MRTSHGRGLLRSIESQLFSEENENLTDTSRHLPNIEKMMESLLESTTLRIEGKEYFFYRPRIERNLERLSLPSTQRKKLSSSLRKKWGSPTEHEFLLMYLGLCSVCGVGLEVLVGIPIGRGIAHFSEDLCRFRHVLGLADAVHLSLFNLGIKVAFPQKVIRKARSSMDVPFPMKVRDRSSSFNCDRNIQGCKEQLASLPPGSFRHRVLTEMLKTFRRTRNHPIRFSGTEIRKIGITGSVVLNRTTSKDRRYRLILHYLRVFPKGKSEKQYVKIIKNSLTDEFSKQMDQERPPCKEGRIPLFPTYTQARLDNRFSKDRKNRCRFYKNLLESKSLCAPVGRDMILEAYEDHKSSLCRSESEVLDVPHTYLQKLYRYGQEVGKFVRGVYNPSRTILPNAKATVESNRRKGGARKALSGSLEIQKGPLYLSLLDQPTRPEPFVVGLFGPPGSGKTTSVVHLVNLLGRELFPDRKGHDLSYSRSCSSKHWDGYEGQPIVILDDFGQNLVDRNDLVEFEQLISTNRYVLPMAELSEKGRCFTSPIVIMTSNCSFGSVLWDQNQKPVVEDYMAVWRRFHLPLRVMKEHMTSPLSQGGGFVPGRLATRVRNSRTVFDRYTLNFLLTLQEENWKKKHFGGGHILPTANMSSQFRLRSPDQILDVNSRYDGIDSVVLDILSRFRSHMDFHEEQLSGTWRQMVSCLGIHSRPSAERPFYDIFVEKKTIPFDKRDVSISYLFPAYPPPRAPVVDAVAIPEPLKVRMITKAEAETKCLQPLQRALFAYLKSRPQFVLTHGVSWGNNEEFDEKLEWILRIESEIQSIHSRRSSEDLWLSGDYTAATDNFPMSITNALIEGILSQIDHEPTKRWVRYEVSSHEIRYPFGLGSGKQTSGQLMGSLLSFPLLCFLNDFIIREAGFEEGKYLINGDDVVALGPRSVIEEWRRKAPTVGLSLSQGKNFIDPHFCTVNSQLFYDAQVQHTGKVSLSTRYGKTLSRCFAEMQYYYGFEDELRREFIRRNLVELRKTPRSLYVPVQWGGLGLRFEDLSPGIMQKAIQVYLHDFTRPFLRSLPVPGCDHIRALRIPVGFFSDEDFDLAGGEPLENEVFDLLSSLELDPPEVNEDEVIDLTHSDLSKSLRVLKSADERKVNQLVGADLRLFPKLGTLRYRTIFIEKGKVGFIKERVLSLVLNLLQIEIGVGRFDIKNDPDSLFLEIKREFEFESDPLFGSDFIRDFSLCEDLATGKGPLTLQEVSTLVGSGETPEVLQDHPLLPEDSPRNPSSSDGDTRPNFGALPSRGEGSKVRFSELSESSETDSNILDLISCRRPLPYTDEELLDTMHLLPTLEPRIVLPENSPEELVFLVRGSRPDYHGSDSQC